MDAVDTITDAVAEEAPVSIGEEEVEEAGKDPQATDEEEMVEEAKSTEELDFSAVVGGEISALGEEISDLGAQGSALLNQLTREVPFEAEGDETLGLSARFTRC